MDAAPPYTLIAELTYRCPLRCAYCSNPARATAEQLGADAWKRVLEEAAALGVVQVHFTGGEPLLFDDLEALVRRARDLQLYPSLITSAVPLERARLAELRRAGLEHVQISIQSTLPDRSRAIAGLDALKEKMDACRWARELDLAVTLNAVLHRENIEEVDGFVALAEQSGALHLELANAQWLGLALENREALLASAAAIARARKAVAAARSRLGARMRISFVLPDYHAGLPRSCMDGWARRYLVVAPDGLALPCHGARDLPLPAPNVASAPLAEIWRRAPMFQAFRGLDWMPEPCRSCERRDVDFGGCRCQAFALTGDAAATDPACSRSPAHGIVARARATAASDGRVSRPITLRRPPRGTRQA